MNNIKKLIFFGLLFRYNGVSGDYFIIYPGYHKLYSSIRFEAMRDGLYDYELFRLLEKKDAEKAKEIVGSVVHGFDDYDSDIHHFRKVRNRY